MELKDLTERLTEEQKKRLAEVKTEDDLKKLMLEDEELNEVAGGWTYVYKNTPRGCFSARIWFRSSGDNNCYGCGAPLSREDKSCPKCGRTWTLLYALDPGEINQETKKPLESIIINDARDI